MGQICFVLFFVFLSFLWNSLSFAFLYSLLAKTFLLISKSLNKLWMEVLSKRKALFTAGREQLALVFVVVPNLLFIILPFSVTNCCSNGVWNITYLYMLFLQSYGWCISFPVITHCGILLKSQISLTQVSLKSFSPNPHCSRRRNLFLTHMRRSRKPKRYVSSSHSFFFTPSCSMCLHQIKRLRSPFSSWPV